MNGSCQAKGLIAVFNELLGKRQEQAVAAVGLTEIDTHTHTSLLISVFSTPSFMPMC